MVHYYMSLILKHHELYEISPTEISHRDICKIFNWHTDMHKMCCIVSNVYAKSITQGEHIKYNTI